MDIQILVVEDDSDILEMSGEFLTKAGYYVDACSVGNKAFEQFYNKNYHLIR